VSACAPSKVASVFTFRAVRHELVVDASDGARTIAYRIDGDNALIDAVASPHAYGSSFWTSPQSDWGWPPPPELDRAPWSASIDEDILVLQSSTSPSLGVAVTQRVSLTRETGVASFEYVMTNRSSAPIRLAPWQNTRVPPRGTTFFPSVVHREPFSTLELEYSGGVAWLSHGNRPARNAKAFAHGSEGWVAHAIGRLLFVKVFSVVPRGRQAPGHGSVEIYVDESARFVEVEQQGRYAEVLPGKRSRWLVRWLLGWMPAEVAEAGLEELAAFARLLVRTQAPGVIGPAGRNVSAPRSL
jgi:hypothetical protein